VPKTKLGKLVYSGKISTMSEALATRLPIKEPEIVDILLPELMDEVLDVNMVQRMTDSGRRVRFAITAVVGNGDGFVGMGRAKGKEVGPTIRNAIDRAKLNIIEVKRGCGSWECGCGTPHTVPFSVDGKCGSVVVTLKPAPRGVGLALGSIAKKVVTMAGIKDSWGTTNGHTKTTVNYSFAAFEALRETSRVKVTSTQAKNLHILTGPITKVFLDTSPEERARLVEEKKKAKEQEFRDKELADSDLAKKPKLLKKKLEASPAEPPVDVLQAVEEATTNGNEAPKGGDAK
jgi:small subunit ribosomal protein S5